MIMEQLQAILAVINKALDEGRGITIKADEITINSDSITATCPEITIDG